LISNLWANERGQKLQQSPKALRPFL
jgi:hypothetical protein